MLSYSDFAKTILGGGLIVGVGKYIYDSIKQKSDKNNSLEDGNIENINN